MRDASWVRWFELVKQATRKHASLFVKFTGAGVMVTFAGRRRLLRRD